MTPTLNTPMNERAGGSVMRSASLPRQVRSSPFSLSDSYKQGHHNQYLPGTTWVYANQTARRSRWEGQDRFVFFGLQMALYKLNAIFQSDFFNLTRDEAIGDFKRFYFGFYGSHDEELYEKVGAIHDLGYLPIRIHAVKEGTLLPHGIPCMTIENTHPDAYWVGQYLESWLSCETWHAATSATTAYYFRKAFDEYAKDTSDMPDFTMWQGHDFSFRGMEGLDGAKSADLGHLTSFYGSDGCPTHDEIERFYWGSDSKMIISGSVPATEHSVASSGILELSQDIPLSEIREFWLAPMENERDLRLLHGEYLLLRRMLTEVYPSGIFSYVSDTYDFWALVTRVLPKLKDEIMARDGKLVLRPDSGDPTKIVIGDPNEPVGSPARRGLIQCLWDIFGGEVNSKGYKQLDPHIGAIYGDSITLQYQSAILGGLKAMKFASTNIVLGIGSYTYQYVTRDTHSIAFKATAVGKGWDYETNRPTQIRTIYKDPKTDTSGKKSARGLLSVVKAPDLGYDEDRRPTYELIQSNTFEDHGNVVRENLLKLVYDNGHIEHQSFEDVRRTLDLHR